MKKGILFAVIALVLVVALSGSFYTLEEDQYACGYRFSEIVGVEN